MFHFKMTKIHTYISHYLSKIKMLDNDANTPLYVRVTSDLTIDLISSLYEPCNLVHTTINVGVKRDIINRASLVG